MKIAVITTNRADYGLLSGLIRKIHQERGLKLQLIVSGTHLSRHFGYTIKEIIRDGFPVTTQIKSESVKTYIKTFKKLKPDMMVVLGDRYEILLPCVAAVNLRIPITHIHGGEITEGVLDEQVRHAVTKMAHLHFTSTETYRRHIVQMGEKPQNVFCLGAPGLENIKFTPVISRADLEKKLKFKLLPTPILVTLHPETLTRFSLTPAHNLLKAIQKLKLRAIFTSSNPDSGGDKITKLFREFAQKNPEHLFVKSLGYQNYLSLIPHVAAVAGNSSSGIIEIPTLKKPTVNIGQRQKGRLMPASVICCTDSFPDITRSLKKALTLTFAKKCRRVKNPYGKGNFSERAIKILKKKMKEPNLLHKTFRKTGVL